MRIGFVGAGRVGKSLAFLFKRAKHDVVGVHTRTKSSGEEFKRFVGNGKTFKSLKGLAEEAEVVFITTNDDAIKEVCDELSQYLSSDQIVFHCSGLLTTKVLEPARKKGCEVGAVHPVQAVPNPHYGVMNIPNSYFDIQCTTGAELVAERLVKDLKCTPVKMSCEEKLNNHLASCLVSNYCVALFEAALQLYDDDRQGLKVLSPLAKQTITNLENLGPLRALTGPVMRGDVGTVEKHLGLIKDERLLEVYKTAGLLILELARKRGKISPQQALRVEELLKK